MTWWLILFHLAEISVWGLFYLWWGCLPDPEAAFYFSAVTYTTIRSRWVAAGCQVRQATGTHTASWNLVGLTTACRTGAL
jgi:hypothetical protein